MSAKEMLRYMSGAAEETSAKPSAKSPMAQAQSQPQTVPRRKRQNSSNPLFANVLDIIRGRDSKTESEASQSEKALEPRTKTPVSEYSSADDAVPSQPDTDGICSPSSLAQVIAELEKSRSSSNHRRKSSFAYSSQHRSRESSVTEYQGNRRSTLTTIADQARDLDTEPSEGPNPETTPPNGSSVSIASNVVLSTAPFPSQLSFVSVEGPQPSHSSLDASSISLAAVTKTLGSRLATTSTSSNRNSIIVQSEGSCDSSSSVRNSHGPTNSMISVADSALNGFAPPNTSMTSMDSDYQSAPYASYVSVASNTHPPLLAPHHSQTSLVSLSDGLTPPFTSQTSISSDTPVPPAPSRSLSINRKMFYSANYKQSQGSMDLRSHLLRSSVLQLEQKILSGAAGKSPGANHEMLSSQSFQSQDSAGVMRESSMMSDDGEGGTDSDSLEGVPLAYKKKPSRKKKPVVEDLGAMQEEMALSWAKPGNHLTLLSSISIFRERPDLLAAISNNIHFESWSPGQTIVREGEPLKLLYWIISGQCLVTRKVPLIENRTTGSVRAASSVQPASAAEAVVYLNLETQDLDLGDWFPYFPVNVSDNNPLSMPKHNLLLECHNHRIECSVHAQTACMTASIVMEEFVDAVSLGVLYSMIRNTPIIVFPIEFLQQEYLEQRVLENTASNKS
ncbi:hypothetical protein HDU91_006103 [Kappamyces sp. JEL0680]|nr:hypothetical protein HDU91_006103 [Kappamyces sp. JEL0680]